MSLFAYPPPAGTPTTTIDLMPHLATSVIDGGGFFDSETNKVSLPSVDVEGPQQKTPLKSCMSKSTTTLLDSFSGRHTRRQRSVDCE